MKTQIWAHRGASAYAPENTMAAFELAFLQGADGAELDVHLTKDREVVVIHDETLDRVSTGTGFVKDYTLKQLRQYSFDKGYPAGRNVEIPTLREVLLFFRTTNMKVNIELKNGIILYEGLEEETLNIVRETGMEQQVIYSSFNHVSLLKMRGLDKEAELGMLYSDGWIGAADYGRRLGVDALHPALYHMQSESLLAEAKANNLRLHIWTVDDEQYIKQLLMLRVDAIITNKPDVCLRVRENC